MGNYNYNSEKHWASRLASVFLAITTWAAIGPELNINYGMGMAIAVCLATGATEFIGYAMRIKGYWTDEEDEKSGRDLILILGILVALTSGTFSIWGAKIIRGMVEKSTHDSANELYDDRIDGLKEEEKKSTEAYLAAVDAFKKEKQRQIDAFNVKERIKEKATQRGLNPDFINRFVEGQSIRGYKKKGYNNTHRIMLEIQEEVERDLQSIKNQTYIGPKPVDNSSYISELRESKGLTKEIGRDTANSLRTIIIILDIFFCLMEIAIQWKYEPPRVRSLAVTLLDRVEYQWQSWIARLEPPPLEMAIAGGANWSELEIMEKMKEIERIHYDELKNLRNEIEMFRETAKQKSEENARLRNEIEVQKTKQKSESEREIKNETKPHNPIDVQEIISEITPVKRKNKTFVNYKNETLSRKVILNRLRSHRNAYKAEKRNSSFDKMMEYWEVFLAYLEIVNEPVPERIRKSMQPYLLKKAK